jgi:hypothetical protein
MACRELPGNKTLFHSASEKDLAGSDSLKSARISGTIYFRITPKQYVRMDFRYYS